MKMVNLNAALIAAFFIFNCCTSRNTHLYECGAHGNTALQFVTIPGRIQYDGASPLPSNYFCSSSAKDEYTKAANQDGVGRRDTKKTCLSNPENKILETCFLKV